MNMVQGINSLTTKASDPLTVSALIKENGIDVPSSISNDQTNKMDKGLLTKGLQKQLGKMDFLRLLTTQLQYQDPFQPMENTEFVSQLAQFSALEGTNNVESAIQNLDKSYKESLDVQSFSALSMTNASAVSLIGKEIRIGKNTIHHTGSVEGDRHINIHLGSKDTVIVKILNRDNEVIRTLKATNKDKENSVSLAWDGKNDVGEFVQPGTYSLYIDGQENDPSLYSFVEDIVRGVRYTAEGPLVKIGGQELPIGNIMDISMVETELKNKENLSATNSLALLGKSIRYKQTELTYIPAEGQKVQIMADLGGFQSALIHVEDAKGQLVHSLQLEKDSSGIAHTEMSCVDFNQNGPYTLRLVDPSSGYFFSKGVIEGISMEDGITKVRVNGVKVALSDITDIASVTEKA